MLFTVPNSGGLPEPEQALIVPLTEKWSDEARSASAAVRKARAKYPTKGDDKNKKNRQRDTGTYTPPDSATVKQVGAQVKARTKAEHDAQTTAAASYEKIHADREKVKAADAKAAAAAAKKKGGGGGGGSKSPTATNETHNEHGERVIQYSDGSTVTVHADGKTATHRKADGTETTGKYHDPAPASKDTPKGFTADTPASKAAAAAKAQHDAEKAAKAKAKAAKPVKQRVLRVKLSRTKKGPRAA